MPTKIRQFQQGSSTGDLFPVEEFLGDSLEKLKTASVDERGAVFTRIEVVNFMLDLTGYTADQPLWRRRLIEPSFGDGEFLLAAVERLLITARRQSVPASELLEAVRGIELHRESFVGTRDKLLTKLKQEGFTNIEAQQLVDTWLINGDFLLEDLPPCDLIVGNPPYVRQELIPAEMLAIYRQRYKTLFDRADLYVPFMERSLQLLQPDGQMSFICSDRWMKNRYGGPLRAMIASGYSLRYYVDMVGTDAFQSEVVAYPAITVIQRGRTQHPARIAHRPEITASALSHLQKTLIGPSSGFNGTVTELPHAPTGEDPWLLESDALPSLDLVRRLEATFPTLEEAGCTVGIGVATGADKVFIGPYDGLDVEDARKLPLATTRDILTGNVQWRGLGVINPYEEDGSLASFDRYPRFAAYLTQHRTTLQKRHCAQRANGSWYRTIDRITASLTHRPKLLIPDIKGEANLVLEDGRLYPHHNLYYITSTDWPLPELHAVLRVGLARLFVRAYSTKMRGGCLRFQAQYLRRIRLPHWNLVTPSHQQALSEAVNTRDNAGVLNAVAHIFQLSQADLSHLTD